MYPFVCVVCPTFKRRQFFPLLFHQFYSQNYPIEKKKLLLYEDGDDILPLTNSELLNLGIKNIEDIYYIFNSKKISLHEKRNKLNEIALEIFNTEYIICMDDDDLYHNNRIKHVIESLKNQKNIYLSGCNKVFLYNILDNEIYENHVKKKFYASNATFGYSTEYLKNNNYSFEKKRPNQKESLSYGEEYSFTNGFTNKLIQLDPFQTILVLVHDKNTIKKSCFKKVNLSIKNYILNTFIYSDPIKKKLIKEIFNEIKL